jgi:hypothetical protein
LCAFSSASSPHARTRSVRTTAPDEEGEDAAACCSSLLPAAPPPPKRAMASAMCTRHLLLGCTRISASLKERDEKHKTANASAE